jgi:hypothetical protein
VSIETKKDEHGPLHRWACLVCEKQGMWIRDAGLARNGMSVHRGSGRHRDRLRERAARLGLAEDRSPQCREGRHDYCRSLAGCECRCHREVSA